MARLSESLAGGRNALAFLDMLAWSEGTSTSPATAMDGYDVIVTGSDRKPEVFKDFADHPFAKGRKSKTINSKGLTSNASGRYQQMLKDWPHYKARRVWSSFPRVPDTKALPSNQPDACPPACSHSPPAPIQTRQQRSPDPCHLRTEPPRRDAPDLPQAVRRLLHPSTLAITSSGRQRRASLI